MPWMIWLMAALSVLLHCLLIVPMLARRAVRLFGRSAMPETDRRLAGHPEGAQDPYSGPEVRPTSRFGRAVRLFARGRS